MSSTVNVPSSLIAFFSNSYKMDIMFGYTHEITVYSFIQILFCIITCLCLIVRTTDVKRLSDTRSNVVSMWYFSSKDRHVLFFVQLLTCLLELRQKICYYSAISIFFIYSTKYRTQNYLKRKPVDIQFMLPSMSVAVCSQPDSFLLNMHRSTQH